MSRPVDSNPLLALDHPLPFDRVAPAHIAPAMSKLTSDARQAIEAIAIDSRPRTYDSTLGALEEATRLLERAHLFCEHTESAATTPEFREVWNAVQPSISEFWSELPLHAGLYAAIKAYSETPEAAQMQGVRQRHLVKTLDEFRRHGAELSADGKKQLTAIDVELSQLTTKFQQNVLDDTNAFELLVEDESRLTGLPPLALAAARANAEQKGKPGYRFTLHAPSFIPAITHLEDPGLRETLYRAYNERASAGSHDNRELIGKILRLRQQKAKLLGFADFSDLVTDDRMAKSGARAETFVADLRDRTRAHFLQERSAIESFAGGPLEAWDVAYYAERQRRAEYDFDEERLRAYFPLERVMTGMFEVLYRLYGVRFEAASVPVWDSAVRPYSLIDESGEQLAYVYVDLFPRDNKVQGAWMAPLITGVDRGVHAAVVAANFTPPVGNTPALLSHREVETLFHEFGHLMHMCLSRVAVRRLAGTSVAWDFVELPSQIMENWTWEREALDLLASHHETGERIPDELFDKLRAAKNFRVASAQMQQLGYASLDLELHRGFDPEGAEHAVDRARAVLAEHVTAKLPESFSMITSFGHLFAGPVGYAAGYYSYKWAEVLEADAFSRFLEEGIFNRQVGEKFRSTLLSRGDSADPEQLFRDFRGRDPRKESLLERQGLLPQS